MMAAVCTDCALALMLETGVIVGASAIAIESAHSGCTRDGCECGCAFSQGRACPDCRRFDTRRGEDGHCSDKKSCAATLAALFAEKRRIHDANVASGVAKPARAGRGAKRPCGCGCGETTGGGRYRPGHDARHVSQLVARTRDGSGTIEDGLAALSHSDLLAAKFRKAVES